MIDQNFDLKKCLEEQEKLIQCCMTIKEHSDPQVKESGSEACASIWKVFNWNLRLNQC